MMRALYTGRLGIKNHQTKMDVVGNNISNVNTVGFKSGRTTFSDMLSQTLKNAAAPTGTVGSTNPLQIGLGVNLSSVDTIFKNGAPVTTDKNTDLCLSGEGLFIVRGGNETYYTRDGAFAFDGEGNYVLPGTGHYVQGWMAADGVINASGSVGDIKVQKGQIMPAKATDLVSYFYNLDAELPVVTGISGGEQVNTTILVSDVSEDNPLPVEFGGKQYAVVGISGNLDSSKTWSAKEDIKLGDTTAEWVNEDGDVVTAKLSPAATFESDKGAILTVPQSILTKSSVTETYPLIARIDGKSFTVVGIDKNLDYTKNWQVKAGGATAGSDTITITDGTDDLVLTLDSPLEESLGVTQVAITVSSTVASKDSPALITLSNGTVVTATEGSYKIGNSMPVTTTVTVYDSTGSTHKIPVYFVREGNESTSNKWLVSLTPDASVTKGQTTTTELVDAEGNTITASLPVAEIQFDSQGNLVTDSEGDVQGTITLSGGTADQNVTVDFSALTQYAGSTTISSSGNGNTEGILTEVQLDSSGTIVGIYSNNVRRAEAQVAVAQFSNPAGLLKNGTSFYKVSANSGTPVVDQANKLGVVMTPGALEMSNVSLANEFAEMIITQRGFQSNAKIVTVGDEMIETAVNMKR
ncbi:MAG: flagellar hook-basal body complex protein [Anaerovibrio sp.]|uniref:flagellar hook protein FlgE n=1 Tax=Anaerovibrio sp. TaxID=1872532 RepID=UPI0025D203ED|nr:flagellar hook-basal body complex protein [Anaerovibrio sp.]MCR5176962.1 flagellar hook-basal body complex protein [Anaerovibrio sp.]